MRKNQKGVVLILTLVFLFAISLLVLESLDESVMQLSMTAKFKDKLLFREP